MAAKKKKLVLVIDDEPSLLKVLLIRLNHSGYKAIGAPSGRAGLELMRQKKPDLILLDKVMPKMSGVEVTRRLKQDEAFKHIPIIMISAEGENMQADSREGKADGHLPKPFASKELLGMIEKHLEVTSD